MKVVKADKKMIDIIQSDEVKRIIVDGHFIRLPETDEETAVFIDGKYYPVIGYHTNPMCECKLVVIAADEDRQEEGASF